MELREMLIREQIRDTLSRYNHAGDTGRVDVLAEQFTDDGVLEIKGATTLSGRAEIIAHLGSRVSDRTAADATNGPPPMVRHHVSSVLIFDVTPDQARADSYFLVLGRHGVDHWGRYRDVLVPVGSRWLLRHRVARVDARVEGSWAPMLKE